MMKRHFQTECPRCGKIDEMTMVDCTEAPVVNCGRCLFDDVEVVALKVTPLHGLSRDELAMAAAAMTATTTPTWQPLSDYERDDLDSKSQISGLRWANEQVRKQQRQIERLLSDYERDDLDSEKQIASARGIAKRYQKRKQQIEQLKRNSKADGER
jgi:hypothetical protein